MAKAIEKDGRPRVARDGVGRRPAGHPVLLQYVLAREGNQGPVLFRLPLGFDEGALVVFSRPGGRPKASPYLTPSGRSGARRYAPLASLSPGCWDLT